MHATTGLTLSISISAALAGLLWTTSAGSEQAFSPRDYCHATGGAVLETGDRDIYICCYAAKQHCLAINTRSRTSVQVIFPDDISDSTVDEKSRSN